MPPYVEPGFSQKLSKAANPDASKGRLHRLGTSSKEDEDLSGGVCTAMCLLRFKRIFQTHYKDVVWKQREDVQAAKTIFLQYMMTQRQDGGALKKAMDLYENHGMKLHADRGESSGNRYAGKLLERGGAGAEDWIKNTPELTCFSIGIPGHAMAGFWKKGAAFFFDPNDGVYELSNINDFAEEVVYSIYETYFKGTDDEYIFFYKVTKGAS